MNTAVSTRTLRLGDAQPAHVAYQAYQALNVSNAPLEGALHGNMHEGSERETQSAEVRHRATNSVQE